MQCVLTDYFRQQFAVRSSVATAMIRFLLFFLFRMKAQLKMSWHRTASDVNNRFDHFDSKPAPLFEAKF